MELPVVVGIFASMTSLGVGIIICVTDCDPYADDDWFTDCPENDLGAFALASFAFASSALWAVTVICAVYFVMSGRHSKWESKHSGDVVAVVPKVTTEPKVTTDSNPPAVKKRHLPPEDISLWSIMSPEPSKGGETDEFEDVEAGCDSNSSIEEASSPEDLPSKDKEEELTTDIDAECDSNSSIEEEKSQELVGETHVAIPPSQGEEEAAQFEDID